MVSITACAVAIFANSTCNNHCGLTCKGYGDLPAGQCSANATSCCGICEHGTDTVLFETWNPISNTSRSECHSTGECLLCDLRHDPATVIHVLSNQKIYLSSDCTYYVPSSRLSVTISMQDGAKNVGLYGPGTVLSTSWPLKPGRNFVVGNQIEFVPPNHTHGMAAVEIAHSGKFQINANAPMFSTLVNIHSDVGARIKLGSTASVRGFASEVLVAAGHASGSLQIGCTANNQSLIVQKTRLDQLTISYFENSQCNDSDVIDVSQLLGIYGQQYDVEFFDGPSPHHIKPVWVEAKYVWYVAGTMLLAAILADERAIKQLATKLTSQKDAAPPNTDSESDNDV